MRPDLPTGTVTFLFTDIAGSTRLLHELGPDAYGNALAQHRSALREAFGEHGGVEVDTQGDAFFVAFPTADDAAAAALAANECLRDGPISVRMGLHTGVPTLTTEGYVGSDVHRGARVAALAHGGQIVVSPTTAALLDGHVLGDLGSHRLKDFDGATRLAQLGEGSFPPLRTPGSIELPAPATRFLGREHELFEAISLFYERDPRVLTVLGPGGTGKTRFTLELCRLLAEDADGGTVFCALAPLRDPGLVLPTIAERLGAAAAEPAAIAARVADKRTHVLIDNAEHLLPDAARPLAELAAAAPGLRLFVTSREALRVQGETELDLPPLAEGEATALFLERAHAVRPDLEDGKAVGELCARLDYLPLALELAAARTKLLSPEALLERLQVRLDVLKGTRDADERHATLRATIAWSYDLLDDGERRLFTRLSVFRGSCTLDAAESVCDADLDVLTALLDKSLVRRRTGAHGEDRLWMLETIRDFAREQLDATPERDDLRRRHAEWALALAESANLYVEAEGPFRHDIVLAEREDVRAALDWTAIHDPDLGLRLAVVLENFWSAHSPKEGEQRVGALLAALPDLPDDQLARALRVYGSAAIMAGDQSAGKEAYERSLALYESLGDEIGAAIVEHRTAAGVASAEGDLDEMHRLLESALEVFRRHGFERGVASVLGTLSDYEEERGNLERALELRRESLEGARGTGFTWWQARQLAAIGRIEFALGDVEATAAAVIEALPLARRMEDDRLAIALLAQLALGALTEGDSVTAGRLWGAACAADERGRGDLRDSPHTLLLRQDAGTDFQASVADGRAVDLWDAVAIALGEIEPDQTVP
jgi:predicted ATPase/class 3 adenylate cyclase